MRPDRAGWARLPTDVKPLVGQVSPQDHVRNYQRLSFRQAVLVLRWFHERGCVHCLARDAGVSQATGYRYPHEGIDVLADQAPDLHEVLDRCRREGMTHVVLDGTLIESDRAACPRDPQHTFRFVTQRVGRG